MKHLSCPVLTRVYVCGNGLRPFFRPGEHVELSAISSVRLCRMGCVGLVHRLEKIFLTELSTRLRMAMGSTVAEHETAHGHSDLASRYRNALHNHAPAVELASRPERSRSSVKATSCWGWSEFGPRACQESRSGRYEPLWIELR